MDSRICNADSSVKFNLRYLMNDNDIDNARKIKGTSNDTNRHLRSMDHLLRPMS